MGAMASQTTSLNIVFNQPFIQAQIKENVKAPRHCPLCGEITDGRWIPAQMVTRKIFPLDDVIMTETSFKGRVSR